LTSISFELYFRNISQSALSGNIVLFHKSNEIRLKLARFWPELEPNFGTALLLLLLLEEKRTDRCPQQLTLVVGPAQRQQEKQLQVTGYQAKHTIQYNGLQ